MLRERRFRSLASAQQLLTRTASDGPRDFQGLVGVGIDVVDLADFEHSVHVGGDRWLRKVFTEHELMYAGGRPGRLAARFAAKEAVVKALGTGFREGVSPRTVEVVSDRSGQPRVALHSAAADTAADADVDSVLVSLSRDGVLAVAVAWAISNHRGGDSNGERTGAGRSTIGA